MKKAIVFTAFDREDYLFETLSAWKNVRGIKDFDIYFKVEDSNKEFSITKIIHDFYKELNMYPNIILNEYRKGVLVNPWEAFEILFEQGYEFVILAEDDILPSKDILEYFVHLEKEYKKDNDVLAICSNTDENGEDNLFEKKDIFKVLIWGTWKDRWTKYLRDTWDKDYSTGVNGTPSGWDWNISLRVIPQNNLKCIIPKSSRSQHIGVEGVHCNSNIFSSTQVPFKDDHLWEKMEEVK